MITILIRDIFLSTDFSNHAVHYAHINQLFKRVQRSAHRVIPAHNHKRGTTIPTRHNENQGSRSLIERSLINKENTSKRNTVN